MRYVENFKFTNIKFTLHRYLINFSDIYIKKGIGQFVIQPTIKKIGTDQNLNLLIWYNLKIT